MRTLKISVLFCGLSAAFPAWAADEPADSAEPATPPRQPLGTGNVQGPGPLVVAPAEVHLPAMGQSTSADDFTFDYHGFFRAPLILSWGKRTAPGPDQSSTSFHVPAVTPDVTEANWLNSNNIPQSWANIFLTYGNKYVTGTIGLGAWHFTASQQTAQQTGNANVSVGPVFLHFKVPEIPGTKLRLDWDVGAFGNRYGYSGKYDFGKYAMFVIGATGAIGETVGVEGDAGDWTFRLEHGFGGNTYPSNSSLGTLTYSGDGGLGTTLLHHAHLFAGWRQLLKVGLHYMTAWSPDERPNRVEPLVGTAPGPIPDGRESVYGADMRFNGGILGELYVGGSYIKADHAETVGPVIYAMNALGGRGLRQNFLGGDTTGSVKSILFQYDYSFAALARYLAHYPPAYWTNGPDITLSIFGTHSWVSSADPIFNGTKKFKVGAELLYSPLKYISVGARADRVSPWLGQSDAIQLPGGETFTVLSPKILLHSDFFTHELVTIQYSHYMYGANRPLMGSNLYANPQLNADLATQSINPGIDTKQSGAGQYKYDDDVFYLSASMWW